ncbi:FeS cluster assembly protein SufD [Candidatus Izimaplasma bacterium HR1]|jgi:Fe-S cluster assembly protein SufD|uniref:SufD family Fe-S cluster assembly protein n=1 Tax=Candidatus Izimoplasma sp. HR1 TaxID=1541959 RepID=UPI0004F623C7|nr:FeS cluster assembly protein SufD [Candidatus Izimaplasma bacterium HR1]
MKSYELIPLKNKEIPNSIKALLTEDLKNYIVLKDGHIIKRKLDESFSGITVETYEDALPEKINIFLDTEYVNDTEGEAYNYNVENVNSGLLIHVPRNTYIEDVLHVFYVQENIELVQNTRIVLEDNSGLKYFEYLSNQTDTAINFVSNAIVKENASLEYTAISKYTKKSVASITRNAFLKRYARANYSVAEVNDGATVSNTNIFLQEDYASGTTKTVAITSNNQEASFTQLVEHLAKETEGYIENYGVANNESALVFEGIGKINKGMKRSIARQSNNGIVLGVNSRLDANPLLLIDEFDVVASHGAAIGKIDDEQLYYLMSRGLSLPVAERLIISGFLSPVLKVLTTDKLKQEFILSVENKTN